MLAIAGAAVGFVPGAPTIRIDIDPQTTLALFIAPVLLDAAYDFPVGCRSGAPCDGGQSVLTPQQAASTTLTAAVSTSGQPLD